MKKLIIFSFLIATCNLSFSQTKKIPFIVEDPYDGKKIMKNTKGDTIWEIFKDGKVAQRDSDYGRIQKDSKGDTIWVKYGKVDAAAAEEAHQKADFLEEIKTAKNNKCPIDIYTGADKQALKNIVINDWKKSSPDLKILKVYITGQQWERKTGYDLNNKNAAKYDNSILNIVIIYEATEPELIENKMAKTTSSYLYKNNLNAGSKPALNKNYDNSNRDSFILLSNVK